MKPVILPISGVAIRLTSSMRSIPRGTIVIAAPLGFVWIPAKFLNLGREYSSVDISCEAQGGDKVPCVINERSWHRPTSVLIRRGVQVVIEGVVKHDHILENIVRRLTAPIDVLINRG